MSIIPLISSWEQYLASHPSGSLPEFGRWLQEQSASPASDALPGARQSLATAANIDASAATTLLINRLNTINYFHSKPIIRKLGLKDAEFGVLVQVHLMDRPNKREICRRLLIENSTGVEITRRLARKGYLRETTDPSDRRSSRLSLTDKGLRLLKEGSAGFKSIHNEFLTPLTADQQQQLVVLLTVVHEYHSARLPEK